MMTLWMMCVVCLWLGLSLDTYRKASRNTFRYGTYMYSYGLVFHSNVRDILTDGLWDIQELSGALTDEDLRRFRGFKNIRFVNLAASAKFHGTGLDYLTNPTAVQ